MKVKVGDRVRVEFDGTVNFENGDGTFDVNVPGIRLLALFVPTSAITVLPPAIERDEVITDADVLDTLPAGSVVSAGGHVWVRNTLAWRTATPGVGGSHASAGVRGCYGPATVLRVGP